MEEGNKQLLMSQPRDTAPLKDRFNHNRALSLSLTLLMSPMWLQYNITGLELKVLQGTKII